MSVRSVRSGRMAGLLVALSLSSAGTELRAQRGRPAGAVPPAAGEFDAGRTAAAAVSAGPSAADATRSRVHGLSAPLRFLVGASGGYVVSAAVTMSRWAACSSSSGDACGGPSQDDVLAVAFPIGAWLIAPIPALASECSRSRRYAWSLAGAGAGAALGALVGTRARGDGGHHQRLGAGAGGVLGAVTGVELCRPART